MKEIILNAHSTARRVQCPGSRQMEVDFGVDEQSESELEGETAHIVARRALEGKKLSDEYPKEMIFGAKLYADTVIEILRKVKCKNPQLYIENRIEYRIPSATSLVTVVGKPDCYIIANDRLHIIEYKYGHRTIYPRRNWQLFSYAYGIIQKLERIPDRVFFTIVQPRVFDGSKPVKKLDLTYEDVASVFSRLEESEIEATRDNVPNSVGPECGMCKARYACPTLQAASLQIAQFSSVTTGIRYTPAQIGNELRYFEYAKKILDARITGLTEQAISHLKNGEPVRGYELTPGRGTLAWALSEEEIRTLETLYGLQLFKKPEPLTPLQAIKEGIDEEFVKTHTLKKPGALKLTQIDEEKMQDIFTNLTN